MDIDAYSTDNYVTWTALHRAVCSGSLSQTKYLLEQGADPDLRVKVSPRPRTREYHDGLEWEMSMSLQDASCAEIARIRFSMENREMQLLLLNYGAEPCDETQVRILAEEGDPEMAAAWQLRRKLRGQR